MLKKNQTIRTISNTYIIQNQIGQGGNGTVFDVVDKQNNHFALKVVEITDNIDKNKIKRFKNEIAFCENNINENIISVLEQGTKDIDDTTYYFYIMPKYNYTLKEAIENTNYSFDDRYKIVTKILKGIKFAHNKNVIHRDLKPQNILLNSPNDVVIADFGIAHFDKEDKATQIETKVSDKLANFKYASPEQRNFEPATKASDIYSLGLIINELFTKKLAVGNGYERIINVSKEYSFLDETVDMMLMSNPTDRIDSIEKVEISINRSIDNIKKTEQSDLIKKKIEDSSIVYNCMEIPEIENAYVNNGEIVIKLNHKVNNDWVQIFKSESYNHSAIMGYEPHSFGRNYNFDEFSIRLHSENRETVKEIIRLFSEWLKIVTNIYNNNEKRNAETKNREEIENYRKQLETIEKDRITNKELQEFLSKLK